MKSKKTYMVIGAGRFGTAVAETLYTSGYEVILVDEDEEAVSHLADCVTHSAVGDARNIEVLRAAGASECDTAVVAMGEELSASVLITLNLKDLGVQEIICKAKNQQYERVLNLVGADKVIIPERETGIHLAQNLMTGAFLDYLDLSGDYGIAEIQAPKSWAGKSLAELKIRNRYGISVLLIKGEGTSKMSTPRADDRIVPGGKLVVMGEKDAIARIQSL